MRFKRRHIKLFEHFLKDPLVVKSEKKPPYQETEDPEDDDLDIDDLEIDDDPDQEPEPEPEEDIVDKMIQHFKKRKQRP